MKKHRFLFLVFAFLMGVFFFAACTKNLDKIPAITAIYPTAAGLGDTVTIIGENLLPDTSQLKVTINNHPVTIIQASPDSIRFVIPETTGSGQVVLSVGGQVYYGPGLSYEYKAVVSTIAGTGAVGTMDGPGRDASFYNPWGLVADLNGDLYIADSYNRRIRKFSAADSTVSSIHIPTYIGDTGRFYSPYNLALDVRSHSLYVTDFNEHVLKIDAAGNLSAIYNGAMPLAGIALGPDDKLYISNNTAGTLLKMDTTGQNSTLFATGLVTPRNIIFDKNNHMYVASGIIYKIDEAGGVSLAAVDPNFGGWEIAVDTAGNFYEADHFSNCIKRIDKAGRVTVVAGNGIAKDIDGVGLSASFDGPQGITLDYAGNLYVTTYNHDNRTGNKVRKIRFE